MAEETTGQGTESTPQQTQTQQTPPPVTHPQSSIDLGGVMTALNALPEQISRAVKEAVTPPKQAPVQKQQSTQDDAGKQQTTQDTKTTTAQTKQTEHVSPGSKKSFADWWFNG